MKQDWDANINAKEALVKQAEALVEQDNLDGIANGAKTLQAQWREIGTTPRGADQKLWRRFRAACDAIFARLDNERDRQRSEQQQLIQALIGDINSFEPEKPRDRRSRITAGCAARQRTRAAFGGKASKHSQSS